MEKCEKFYFSPNTKTKIWYNKQTNIWHRLNGPAAGKLYYINNKIYYNFLEYIQNVIIFKKRINITSQDV